MDIRTARAAIEAILAAIPDDALPEFDKVEIEEGAGRVCAWFGGTGHYLGSAKTNGERDPLHYRREAARQAIELEMTYRADRRLLDNDDNHKGVRLGRRKVSVA